jgi:hypothetical protein
MPVWTDDDGVKHHLVPLAVHGAQAFEYRNSFYLDTGPLVLVFAGLLDADDPMMVSTLKWFREGPPAKVYRYDSDCWQVPSLYHEISSCEPCFSWNLWHSHQLGDRERFLEGMYSLFTGMVSRQTHISCETRGGVTGICTVYTPFFAARNAVIDDQIKENELHLMRMMPLAWLSEEKESRFEDMPTEFGPVTLKAQLGEGGKELHVSFRPRFRLKPDKIMLHMPPVGGLERAVINGVRIELDGKEQVMEISV